MHETLTATTGHSRLQDLPGTSFHFNVVPPSISRPDKIHDLTDFGVSQHVAMEDQDPELQDHDPLADPEEKRVLLAALDSFWYVAIRSGSESLSPSRFQGSIAKQLITISPTYVENLSTRSPLPRLNCCLVRLSL